MNTPGSSCAHKSASAGLFLADEQSPPAAVRAISRDLRQVQVCDSTQGPSARGLVSQAPWRTAAASGGQADTNSLLTWLAQPLPVNDFSDDTSPMDGLVPRPKQPLSRQDLEEDDWLAVDCKEPAFLATFNALLQERRSVEERMEEFCFPPLETTLRNMLKFLGHIRCGKQFHGRLTAAEDQALAWAEERTAALLQAGAPYKRTVCLTVACVTLCEIITDRLVLCPLKEAQPAAFRQHVRRVEVDDWYREDGVWQDRMTRDCSGASLDPALVTALCWGGNNPGGGSETDELFTGYRDSRLWQALSRLINDPHLLIYPSFQPLGIGDFCRFGHLAMHPVGLTTEHALGADGLLMSPLEFAAHDMGHMRSLRAVGLPRLQAITQGPDAWYRCDRRLGWRCLLLDRLPQRLAPLRLGPALQLFLFQIFHERSPEVFYRSFMDPEEDGFVCCFRELASLCRSSREAYSAEDLAITDREMALAALWTASLFACWQDVQFGPVTDEALAACAQAFVNQAVPWLDGHLGFVSHNRNALRCLFADPAHCNSRVDEEGGIRIRCRPDFVSLRGLTLFASDGQCTNKCYEDNTDVVYFSALHSPVLCQKIAERFGEIWPGGGAGLVGSACDLVALTRQ